VILTGLAPDPRRPDYRLVELDRGRFASLPAADLANLGLQIGAELSDLVYERLQELADLEAAHRAGLRALARRAGVPVSIDTSKAEVARAAIEVGAEVVNDVSGLQRDPEMGRLAARTGAALCLMHIRGTPRDMQRHAVYADLLGEVHDELLLTLARAGEAGVLAERIALDPGLGFAKTGEHNLLLLRRLRELTQLGRPLLIGASRKSFLGKLSGRPPSERLAGSIGAAVVAALHGASILRVHDVAATREALAVADAVDSFSR